MDGIRLAPTAGIAASVVFLAVLVLPYLLVGTPGAATTYFGVGPVNPLFAGLFALVNVIVFAAGREERSDPAVASGAALVMSVAVVVIVGLWVLADPQNVILSLDEAGVVQWLEYHPLVTFVVALAQPASAAWYVRALGLV